MSAARIRDEYRSEAEKAHGRHEGQGRGDPGASTDRGKSRRARGERRGRRGAVKRDRGPARGPRRGDRERSPAGGRSLAVQELEAARKEIEHAGPRRRRSRRKSGKKRPVSRESSRLTWPRKTSRRRKKLLAKAQAQAEQDPSKTPRRRSEGDQNPRTKELLTKAQAQAEQIVKDARSESKKIEPKTKDLLSKAQAQAEQIVKDAEAKAKEIDQRQRSSSPRRRPRPSRSSRTPRQRWRI